MKRLARESSFGFSTVVTAAAIFVGLGWIAPRGAAQDFSAVTQPIGAYLSENTDIPGAALLIVQGDTVLYEQYWGTYDRQTQLRIGSATKWLSGAVIMSLVDDGLIDLDAPAWTYLPDEFPQGRPGSEMTVRQMFSHTSGLTSNNVFISPLVPSLERSVELIGGNADFVTPPGEAFDYGGVSMQVAGRIAEVVTGESWETLFNQRLAEPLGMTATDFQGLGPTTNPRIAGGAQSSLDDYARFLEMLQQGGVYDGQAVLSPEAVATMLDDQTNGAVFSDGPASLDEYHGYGIGSFILEVDSEDQSPVEFASPGLFGATPWINPDLDLYGLFLIDDMLIDVSDLIDEVRRFTREDAATPLSSIGDYNADGFVSQADLDLVLLNWGSTTLPDGFDPDAIEGGGPFDNLISQNELDGVLLNWGDGTPPSHIVVPEAGHVGATLVIGTMISRRRLDHRDA